MFPQQSQVGTNLYSNNTLLRNSSDQIHQTQIRALFASLEESQKGSELYGIIQTLTAEARQYMADLDTCDRLEAGLAEEGEFWKEVKERCLRVRKNGAIIVAEMCKFKESVARLAAHTVDRDPRMDNQYRQVHDQIRKTKIDIATKLQKIRQARAAKAKAKGKGESEAEGANRESKNIQSSAEKIVLIELKDAVEVVDLELIKQRE